MASVDTHSNQQRGKVQTTTGVPFVELKKHNYFLFSFLFLSKRKVWSSTWVKGSTVVTSMVWVSAMCITVICPSSLVSAPQVRSGSGEAVACSSQASLKKSKHAAAGSHRYATISRSHTNSCSQRNSWGEVVGETKNKQTKKKPWPQHSCNHL